MIKKLIWLIKHKEQIEELILKNGKNENKDSDKYFSIAGVPDFQKDYVNDLLNGNKK